MSTAFEIQLEGNIKFSTVDADGVPDALTLADYGDEIASLVVNRTRNTVDRKPTFADARTIKRAADLVETVTINFLGDEGNATGFHKFVWDALETPPCIVYFEATMKPGAVSATNPQFTGYATVVDVDSGGTPGDSKWQGKTWPAFGVERIIIP